MRNGDFQDVLGEQVPMRIVHPHPSGMAPGGEAAHDVGPCRRTTYLPSVYEHRKL
ncbi:MAG: hypothetical protein IMX03_04140 [Brockia lithotrophica]|nr:hypothetical protein [Brockia lithotrophica]